MQVKRKRQETEDIEDTPENKKDLEKKLAQLYEVFPTCPICREEGLPEPIGCGHYVCTHCMPKFIQSSLGFNIRMTRSGTGTQVTNVALPCPYCRVNNFSTNTTHRVARHTLLSSCIVLGKILDLKRRDYSCPYCELSFDTSEPALRHIIECPKRDLSCPKCSLSIGSSLSVENLAKHAREACLSRVRCNMCLLFVPSKDVCAHLEQHTSYSSKLGKTRESIKTQLEKIAFLMGQVPDSERYVLCNHQRRLQNILSIVDLGSLENQTILSWASDQIVQITADIHNFE